MNENDKKQLVYDYGDKISRLSHRMIWNPELAKEASQEVWYEILKSIETFKGESNISTWIYTIARRTIYRIAKSDKTLSTVELNEHFQQNCIEYTGNREQMRQWAKEKCDYCLTAFCHCLSTEARLIFLFRTIAELPYEQICQIMGKKEENIRKMASRSKVKVTHFMEKDCILFNPEGNCRCKIRKHIIDVKLDDEYRKLEKAASLIDFFKKFDNELPSKNFWEDILSNDVTKQSNPPLNGYLTLNEEAF